MYPVFTYHICKSLISDPQVKILGDICMICSKHIALAAMLNYTYVKPLIATDAYLKAI